jgi:hypothetical protein
VGRKAETRDSIDPRGLIREAYNIEGITDGECRSIFLDWAIGVPPDEDTRKHVASLLTRYGEAADHPMTKVLKDGLGTPQRTGRRGGRKGRLGT